MVESAKPHNCLAPNPLVKKPDLVLPVGSWDCHAHVFGPTNSFPYLDTCQYSPPESLVEDYLALLEGLGLSRGVLVQPSVYGYDISCLLSAIHTSPNRLRGVIYARSESLTVAQINSLHSKGIRGVRVNAALNTFSVQALRSLATVIADQGWHISLQVRDLQQVKELAVEFQSLPAVVVIEGMGKMKASLTPAHEEFLCLLRLLEKGKAWAKLSHVYRVSSEQSAFKDVSAIARALINANPTAVIWGMDWPHPMVDPMPNDDDLVDLLEDWCRTDQQLKQLLVDNPTVLYE